MTEHEAAREAALGDALMRAGAAPEFHKLVDGELSFDADGKSNADALVAESAKRYPELFKPQPKTMDQALRSAASAGSAGRKEAMRARIFGGPRSPDGRFAKTTGPGSVDGGSRAAIPAEEGPSEIMDRAIRTRAGL